MKKLKKVLSLVLVLAMALSMFGVCASATDVKDYSDYDKITYSEAVGVLSGLGVLQGDDTGTFRPTDTLKRSEAAKIATYLVGLQDNNVAEGTKFTDIKGHWAEEYITIAESINLVAGMGDGTFAPDGILTGYQWEKMVLCALGYSAEYENMLGANWEGGVAILAKKVDLLKDLAPTYDATKQITREEAAQIAYNALFTETVKYKLNGATHTLAKQDVTLGMKVFGLCAANVEFDVFGAPTGKVYRTVKGDLIASFGIDPVFTYDNIYGGTSFEEIYDDVADSIKAPVRKTEFKAFVDGDNVTPASGAIGDKVAFGGRGTKVAVYQIEEETTTEYRIVEINTYVDKIGVKNLGDTVYIQKYAPNTNGNAKPADIVGLQNNAYLAAEGFQKDDVIVYNVGNERNLPGKPDVDAPVAVNAEVKAGTAGKASTVSFSGSEYDATHTNAYVKIGEDAEKTYFDVNAEYGISKTENEPAAKLKAGATYVYYYDSFDNIIYVADYKPVPVSAKGHLYVIDAISYNVEHKSFEDGLYYPVLTYDVAAQALVIEYTEDSAEVKVVDLAFAQGTDKQFYFLNEYGIIDGSKRISAFEDQTVPTVNKGFAEYYVTESGEYIIRECKDAQETLNTAKAGKNITVKKDAAANESSIIEATVSTKMTYITATFDPATLITHQTIADVAKSFEVTVKTVNGYGQFDDFNSRKIEMGGKTPNTNGGYVERDMMTGKATVGAVIGVKAVEDETIYAKFLGAEAEDDKDGMIFRFVGSDGVVFEKAIADYASYANGERAKLTMEEADVGKVFKLSYNSLGEITGKTEITASAEADASLNDIDEGTVKFSNWKNSGEDYGYIQIGVTADPTATYTYDFASVFGGKAYVPAKGMSIPVDETAADPMADPARRASYVKIYTDGFKGAPGQDDVARVVFVEVVDPPVATGNCEATYTGSAFVDANGKTLGNTDGAPIDCKFQDGTHMTSVDNELNMFINRKFNMTWDIVYGLDGNPTIKNMSATAQDADFYVYKQPSNIDGVYATLTYVGNGAVGTPENLLEATWNPSYAGEGTLWGFCSSPSVKLLFVQVKDNGEYVTYGDTVPVGDADHTITFKAYQNCAHSEAQAKIVVYTVTETKH